MLDTVQYLLGAGSGVLVGFVLGLVGGGGSILAVPLMVYLVGVPSPHVAIGTSALTAPAVQRSIDHCHGADALPARMSQGQHRSGADVGSGRAARPHRPIS